MPSTKSVNLRLSVVRAAISLTVSLVAYTMAQVSRAITPRDPGGPWGQRIGVNMVGSDAWALRVTAVVTKRNNSSDWWRYIIVGMSQAHPRFVDVNKMTVPAGYDNTDGMWDPQNVTATIAFREQQVRFPFLTGYSSLSH